MCKSWADADDKLRKARAEPAAVLEALTPFFDGAFRPPMIDRTIPLAEGLSAYEQVARGEVRGRLVLVP
jgi:hypothetical protein